MLLFVLCPEAKFFSSWRRKKILFLTFLFSSTLKKHTQKYKNHEREFFGVVHERIKMVETLSSNSIYNKTNAPNEKEKGRNTEKGERKKEKKKKRLRK